MDHAHSHDHDPLRPHSHEPNPQPPSADETFRFYLPDGPESRLAMADLQALPETVIPNCYIVSTGHGTSGPFTFAGATLLALIESRVGAKTGWSEVEVISADGFGNRVTAADLYQPDPAGPILLAYKLDDQLLTRAQGLVRMIVPSEKDDALRQVKWVGEIRVK
jgi:hypothetical protein